MDRRNFIKSGLLASMALSVLPATKLFAGHSAQIYAVSLPATQHHIRHGLLKTRIENQPIEGIQGISHLQKDIFHADGIGASPEDLISLTLVLEGKQLQLGIKNEHVFYSEGNVTTEHSLYPNQPITLKESPAYEIQLWSVPRRQNISVPFSTAETLFLPLQGSLQINGFNGSEGQAILAQKVYNFNIRTTQSRFLQITRRNKE